MYSLLLNVPLKDYLWGGNRPRDEYEKKQYLFNEQKKTLDSFLKRNSIFKQQYDKSLGDLRAKWV